MSARGLIALPYQPQVHSTLPPPGLLPERLANFRGNPLNGSRRYAKTLASVADTSEAHAAVVFLALESALPSILEDPPRNYGQLVELLEQLCARRDTSVEESARTALGKLRGSSKAAKSARRICERPHQISDRVVNATRLLTEMRISAASRWTETE